MRRGFFQDKAGNSNLIRYKPPEVTGKHLIRHLAHHHVSNSRESPSSRRDVPHHPGCSLSPPRWEGEHPDPPQLYPNLPPHVSQLLCMPKTLKQEIAWLGIWQSHPSTGEPCCSAFNLGKNEALARVWDPLAAALAQKLGRSRD